MNAAIGRAFELLRSLRENRHDICLHQAAELDGFVSALFWTDVITADQFSAFRSLAVSAFSHSGEPYPCPMNAGPVIPSWVAHKRAKQPPKPQAVPASEPIQLHPASAPRKLRLLCLLDSPDVGEHTRSYPVAAMFPLPPCAYRIGRWQATLPPGLEMRETSAVAPSASILVRLQRRGQASAFCPDSRTVRIGVAG